MSRILPSISFNGPGLLPERLQPYAKAVYPFVTSLVGAGVIAVFEGAYDAHAVEANVLGLLLTGVAFFVPNKAHTVHHVEDDNEDDTTTTLGTPVEELDPDEPTGRKAPPRRTTRPRRRTPRKS